MPKTRIVHALLLLFACAAAEAQPEPASETPEVIVVTGHLPGPPLWRVSKGDKVLWIFGMLDTIPVGMQWESARVEKVLAQAEEYISPPGQGLSVGLMTGLKLLNPISLVRGYRLMKRLSLDPDGKALNASLPPELYQRFAAVKSRYFPKNKDIEEHRPFFAMDEMGGAVRKQEGLGSSAPIKQAINELAAKNRQLVRTNPSVITKLELGYSELAERAEKVMKTLSRDKELSCFAQELDRMEVDVEATKRRANAWAKGNIDELREIKFKTPEENPCLVMMAESSEGELLKDLGNKAHANWLAAAENALDKRHTSFAVLGINELLSDTGLLAKLIEQGYEVREPD